MGEELRQQGLPATSKAWTTADANNIVKEIAENKNQQWQVRDEKEVQRLANSGVIVVGVYNGEPRKEHGHVAIAFPLPPHFRTSQFPGSGPFVRDGNTSDNNTEGRLYSRSWGAVRASKVFGSSRRPTWYIWVPSQK